MIRIEFVDELFGIAAVTPARSHVEFLFPRVAIDILQVGIGSAHECADIVIGPLSYEPAQAELAQSRADSITDSLPRAGILCGVFGQMRGILIRCDHSMLQLPKIKTVLIGVRLH